MQTEWNGIIHRIKVIGLYKKLEQNVTLISHVEYQTKKYEWTKISRFKVCKSGFWKMFYTSTAGNK